MISGITSDQFLYDIAERKQKLLDEFLLQLKSVSVDCEFNRMANRTTDPSLQSMKCVNTDNSLDFGSFTPPGSEDRFIYAPNRKLGRTLVSQQFKGSQFKTPFVIIDQTPPFSVGLFGSYRIAGLLLEKKPRYRI